MSNYLTTIIQNLWSMSPPATVQIYYEFWSHMTAFQTRRGEGTQSRPGVIVIWTYLNNDSRAKFNARF